MMNKALDPQAVLARLGVDEFTQVEPVTGGQDTAIWRVTTSDGVYALRVFRSEQAATCAKEMAVMRLAGQHGLPVPTVVRYGTWENRPALMLSWVNGRTLADALQDDPSQVDTLGRAFGAMQARIHSIPAPSDKDAASWIDWAGDEPALKTRLLDIQASAPRLLHLDYHPLNVMLEGDQVSGVLDWANARAGDPRADFARTYAILRVEPYGPDGDAPQMAEWRIQLEHVWRGGYELVAGALPDMAPFYAWAGAVMIRDQSQRIGKPGHWLEDHHLDSVRAWRDHWKRQAGIVDGS